MSIIGLGRRAAPDARDAAFPMRLVLPDAPLPAYKYWPHNGILDQGRTGACVAFAWLSLRQGSPVRCKPDPALTGYDLYRKIVLEDEWTENDSEATATDIRQMQFGTSVRAGAKVLQAMGWLSGYVWTQSMEDIERHILLRGPVVVGTRFYRDMATLDAQGIVNATGPLEGGHAYVIDGANRRRGVVRWRNSWGLPFGIRGCAYMTYETLDRLLFREDGEACAPTEEPIHA